MICHWQYNKSTRFKNLKHAAYQKTANSSIHHTAVMAKDKIKRLTADSEAGIMQKINIFVLT